MYQKNDSDEFNNDNSPIKFEFLFQFSFESIFGVYFSKSNISILFLFSLVSQITHNSLYHNFYYRYRVKF